MLLKLHNYINVSLQFSLFTAPDTIPPTIQCPQQPINQASTGGNAQVTFARPTAQDNCNTVNVACRARSPTNSVITLSTIGSNEQGSFPVGTSTVSCTASDGVSLTTTCDFNVIGMLNNGLKFQHILSRIFEIYKLFQNSWSQYWFSVFCRKIVVLPTIIQSVWKAQSWKQKLLLLVTIEIFRFEWKQQSCLEICHQKSGFLS